MQVLKVMSNLAPAESSSNEEKAGEMRRAKTLESAGIMEPASCSLLRGILKTATSSDANKRALAICQFRECLLYCRDKEDALLNLWSTRLNMESLRALLPA